ncbi:HAD family hydrolase [Aquihabitans sp. McL0605]|uniref:HAD family hydrolase n=1 Tax=Aquihabitans sp. McL0605 TaxID=3415671 RepID=UPI003CEAC424
MTAPTVLVMDLGGVTCRWLPDRRLDALAALSGLPAGTIDQQVFGSGFDDAGERGRFTLAAFTEQLVAVLGLAASPDDDQAVRTAWSLAFEPDRAVLRLIRAATCRTALFTNNGPLLEAALRAELSDVGDAFDQLVLSHRLGVTKPEAAAFERATEALGAAPGDVFFVDDSPANVAAAAAAGWRSYHFTTALSLQAALTDAHIL